MAVDEQFRVQGSEAQFIDWTFDISDGTRSMGVQTGIQELNWKESRDQGEVRDNGSPYVEDTTSGEYSADGSMKWKRSAWDEFRDGLAAKNMGPFSLKGNITCTYRRKNKKITKVFLERVEFGEVDSSNSQGTDGLTISVNFKFKRVFQNGRGPFGEKFGR